MKYSDLSINLGFHKNMQETNWLKLFPIWWAENDPLIESIGKEIAYIKAESIFSLLNVALKPPVMIWQESLNHKNYIESFTINVDFSDDKPDKHYGLIKLPAPLYKTYGTIHIKNNTLDDISNLTISLNDTDNIVILDVIRTNDIIDVHVGSQKVYINNEEANIIINGDGLPYFKTGIDKKEYIPTVTTEIDNDVICYTVTVPNDFTGKVSIINSDKDITLYNDYFYDEECKDDITEDDSIMQRVFYVANAFPNNKDVTKTPNIDIRLHSDPLYFNTYVQAPTNKYKIHKNPKPLHNESINLSIDFDPISEVNMDFDITFDNVVFINEQNIEVHGLELIPIKSVNLYAYYDFPYNQISTGWRKVYEKEYDPKTAVVYDMITTHFYTKKFYVEVFFEGVDYPYQVGFPCDKDASEDSMYHINDNIDKWGEYFGLKRRLYKTNIAEEDYPFTYPPYYPYNIEQDYWYYKRLISEYAWNDLAINNVDLLDTNGDPIVRLNSIDPFIQDFVVYANSTYPKEKENLDYSIFLPTYVTQDTVEAEYKRMPYYDTHNLLKYDNNKASITLLNKAGTNITTQRYLSKPLRAFFDLTNLPDNIDLNDITILVEAEATDNNIDKYSNSETGIIIPGISETQVFKMIQSDNYELKEKEIEYHLSDTIDKIKKQYDKIDNNVIQLATVRPFSSKQNTYVSIPFVLQENDEIVDDITEVYVTYEGYGTYQGTYHNIDNKGRYIKVYMPEIIPDKTIYNVDQKVKENGDITTSYITKKTEESNSYEIAQEVIVTISCKTETHNSFTGTNIPLKTRIVTNTADTEEDKELNFLEVSGPYVDGKMQIIYVEDEWHTGDLRNIIQKDGIYFVNTFENDNETNTPAILLKNVRLKINHQPKKSIFTMDTRIRSDKVESPYIAQLEVTITNIGYTELQSKVDIVNANNIKLSRTYFDIDLGIGESKTETIDILPEYPILDGEYEILTVCEDVVCQNSIILSASGLIETGIITSEYYGLYNEVITLNAQVNNVNHLPMNDGKLLFYIDKFYVGESTITDGQGSINIQPSNEKYLDPGMHILEIRFSGTEKFASSRISTSLLIVKNNTNIVIESANTGVYGNSYTIETYITSNDINIDEGSVTFYIDDQRLGDVEVHLGKADITIPEEDFKFIPGNHIITVVYNGTHTYVHTETTKTINIIGGETTTEVSEVLGKPDDIVTLKARVVDMYNIPLSIGKVFFQIYDGDNLIETLPAVPVNLGMATTTYHIDKNILNNLNMDASKQYTIKATYVDDGDNQYNTVVYQSSTNTNILTIQRGEVNISYSNIYFGSKHEPLGFYLKLTDSLTGEPVTDGTISINIPALNDITTPAQTIDEDGGVRILYNPLTFTADEFNQLLKFYFTFGQNLPIEEYQPLYYDEAYTNIKNLQTISIITDIELIEDSDNTAYGKIKYNTKEVSVNDSVQELNGAILNLKYTEDNKFTYDIFSTTDDTIIKDIKNLSSLDGVVNVINYSKGLISYIETVFNMEEITEGFKEHHLYRIYTGELLDLNLMDFELITNPDGTKHLFYHIYDEDSKSIGEEQIFIDQNGHLYARTTIDPLEIRNYPTGKYPINIIYNSEAKYKNKNISTTLKLNQGVIDIDIHSQKIKYNDVNKEIICYVTEYNLGEDQINTTLVNDGTVIFFIDGERIKTTTIENGEAKMSSSDLYDIDYGPHLLQVEYLATNKETTYTYTDIQIQPITPFIHGVLNRKFKGQKSKLSVILGIDETYKIPITGSVNIYLDDVLIDSRYLFGFEDLEGNIALDQYTYEHMDAILLDFVIDIPNDIDTTQHTLYIEYTGDKHLKPASDTIILTEEPLTIDIDTSSVYVAQNNYCQITYDIISPNDDGFINDGEIALYAGEDNLITKGFVKNNKATLNWLVEEDPGTYTYYIKLIKNHNYTTEPITQLIKVIEAQDDVYIAQNSSTQEIPYDYQLPLFKDLQSAIQCVKDNGNVHIVDKVYINNDVIVNKNVNIIGNNNAQIIKDLTDLLTTDNGTIKKYSTIDFTEPLYEIVGLKKEHLNTTDFHIIDTDLFYVRNDILIPIFLLTDNKFYAYQNISLSEIISNIGLTLNEKVTFNNIHFTSIDSNNINDLVIKCLNDVDIQKSIIDKTVTINNQGLLTINTSAIYGRIIGSKDYNLDNNWWGQNMHSTYYHTNNHIILTMFTRNDPPVIGDNIQIYARLIGVNGVEYDLPQLKYYFEAESGEFSLPSGVFSNNVATTTYVDGAKECEVHCKVDDEDVSLTILDYNRKTEVILDPATDIPIGYQIPLRAKVQSLADTYYKFNNKLEVIEESNEINNGYVNFYIGNDDNKKQIGHIKVQHGIAELPMYFSNSQYPVINNEEIEQYTLRLTAEYIPKDYYFKSIAAKDINLVSENDICFVSPQGDNGEGGFDNPYNSINHAILSNKKRIYLKPGIYEDTQISVIGTQNIKAYNGECSFNNKDESIFIGYNNDAKLKLIGLTFANHQVDYLIKNINDLELYQCIFYHNKCKALIDNNNTTITYSVIIPNEFSEEYPNTILKDYNKTYTISQCWFGTNTPNEDLNEPNTLTDYIVMEFTSSKDKIYLGSVAHLTASINHYSSDGNEFHLMTEDLLPLRIAHFDTTHGSLMPITDYTHNDKSVTFLNTNEENNTDKVLITTPDNENYINQKITLQCKVQTVQGQDAEGQVRFKFIYNNDAIILFGDLVDGVATVEHNVPLNAGEYILECVYGQYKHMSTFTVSQPKILKESLVLNSGDYLYDMSFVLNIKDSFDSTNINQDVNIYIDDTFIQQATISNGILRANLTYNMLNTGQHTLLITNQHLDSNYQNFNIPYDFIVNKKNTHIQFDYNGLPIDEPIDLTIKVYDDNQRLVQNGSISIIYDNEIVYTNYKSQYDINGDYESIELNNGVATIYNFNAHEQGQHSIVINYSGDELYYNKSLFVNNNFNVGLEEVVIESVTLNNQLSTELGQPLKLYFPIKDHYGNNVKRGEVNLYLDSSKVLLTKTPIKVVNGYVTFEGNLPVGTKAMEHDFIITYTDPSNKFLPTTYNTKLKVNKIKTQIITDTIHSAPNSVTTINYTIEAQNGTITSGRLETYYEDNLIGWTDVSSGLSQIKLNIPMLSAQQTYDIIFKYIAPTDSNYAQAETTSTLIITKPQIQIEPQISDYYPKHNFNYEVNVYDQNNKTIDFGTIILYIDNVKTATQDIQKGYVSIPLNLDTVKKYNFDLVYQENDYYERTKIHQDFCIDYIHITDITLDTTSSLPNTTLETTLNITTPNQINVTDGLLDICIDDIDNKIGVFSVVEDTKYVKLHIPNLSSGAHDIFFKYYDSDVFKDDNFQHIFNIEEQSIELTVPEFYETDYNNNITFDIGIDKKIDGFLEYYLFVTEDGAERSQFLGIQSINYQNTITFTHELPNILSSTSQNKIQVKFLGNDQYQSAIAEFPLIVNKIQPTISELIVSEEVEYQSDVLIKVKTDLTNDTIIYFYLESEDQEHQIGYKQANNVDNDGYVVFNYNLNNDYIPSETPYTIIAVIKESVVLSKTSEEATFKVIKGTPMLDSNIIEAYVGTKITLPSNIIDKKGFDVTTGTLTYKYNNEIIENPSEYQLDQNYHDGELVINVEYVAATDSYYTNFTDDIIVQLQKNIIIFDIDNYGPITRGEKLKENITYTSPTIDVMPQNLQYNVYFNDVLVTDISNFTIPLTLPDQNSYILSIEFTETDMFKQIKEKQNFTILNKNKSLVKMSEVTDLASAFNLVADYGIIEFDKNVDNDDSIATNNKNVTIQGNSHTLSKSQIVNNGTLTINNLIFTDSKHSAVTNNGKLYVQECTFSDNSAQYGAGIYINNKSISTDINQCVFNANVASLYGGAIFSNKGNNVTIQSCTFANKNGAKVKGASIASSGEMYLSQNMFYDNNKFNITTTEYQNKNEIYIIDGILEAENNYFDGKINVIENNGSAICNLNYWGYNDIDSIKANNIDNTKINNEDPDGIIIDTWLISRYEIDYTEPHPNMLHKIITPRIDRYKNTLEREISVYKNVIGNVPVKINNADHVLNEQKDLLDDEITIVIGQQTLKFPPEVNDDN